VKYSMVTVSMALLIAATGHAQEATPAAPVPTAAASTPAAATSSSPQESIAAAPQQHAEAIGATAAAALPGGKAGADTSSPAQGLEPEPDAAPPTPETLKKAKQLGMFTVFMKGATRYCWRDANTGTRFPTTKCTDAIHLDEIIEMREAVQIDMRRNMTGTWNK
jgi:hypothetical protein